jgi:EmrB/QacA subfamily drug resistance transporter
MAAVAIGIFLATIDASIVNMALPILEQDLHTDFAIVQWVVLAYLVTVTTLLLSIGRLADMMGKKSIYAAGMIVFTAGSVLCGLSQNIATLIAFRVLQAAGAAMIMALANAIITEAFPASERGKALGIGGLFVSVGIIAGPTIGGLLLGAFSWHWIFFVNLPIGIIGVLMTLRFVPASRPPSGQRFDLPGAACLFLALLAFLMGLTIGQTTGYARTPVIALFGVFISLLAVFLAIESRTRQPMIDLQLFSNRLFSINLVTGLLAFISSAGTVLLMPYYLQDVRQYSPLTAGLLLAVVPAAVATVAPWAGSLSDRFGTRPLAAIGLGTLVVGYAAASTLRIDTGAVGYVLRFVPVGLGIGFFQSPNNSAVMGAVPRERLGVASGLLSLTRTLGQTIGIAAVAALWAARVAAHSGSTAPEDATIAPASIQVTALNDTLHVIVGLIGIALLLSLWALWQERQTRAALRSTCCEPR